MLSKKLNFYLSAIFICLNFFPLFLWANHPDLYDHVRLLKKSIHVEETGDLIVQEDWSIWVGSQHHLGYRKITDAVFFDVVRPQEHNTEVFVESVSCDEFEIGPIPQKSIEQRSLIIKSPQRLKNHQEYHFHLKYRYKGLLRTGLNNHLISLDYPVVSENYYPILNFKLDLSLHHDAEIHQFMSNVKDRDDRPILDLIAPDRDYAIHRKTGKNNLQFSIQEKSAQNRPLRLDIIFTSPSMLQALSNVTNKNDFAAATLREKSATEHKTPVLTDTGRGSKLSQPGDGPYRTPTLFQLQVCAFCVLASYFLVAQRVEQRKREYQNQYHEYIQKDFYHTIPQWVQYYFYEKHPRWNSLQALLYSWYQQQIVSFEIDEKNQVILKASQHQRKKMSPTDRYFAQIIFWGQQDLKEVVWEKTFNARNVGSLFLVIKSFPRQLKNAIGQQKNQFIPWFIFLSLMLAPLVICSSFIYDHFGEEYTKMVFLAWVLIAAYCRDQAVFVNKSGPQNLSARMTICGVLLGLLSYLMTLSIVDETRMLLALCAIYAVYFIEAIIIFDFRFVKFIVLQDIAQKVKPKNIYASDHTQWPQIWEQLKIFLKALKQHDKQESAESSESIVLKHLPFKL